MPEMHATLPVHGYSPQSTEMVDLVNANKLTEENILALLDELERLPTIDKRWLAIGRTHIEQGWMAVNRAIFKPKRIE